MTDNASLAEPPTDPSKSSWRATWLQRREDRFAEALFEADRASEEYRPQLPPPRRRPTSVGKWLKRSKLWDDIFTRTVANVLSVVILGVIAGLLGLIHLDRRAWAGVTLIGGAMLGVIIANVYPVRYLKHQWVRWVILYAIFMVATVISLFLNLPFAPRTAPSSDCFEVFDVGC